LKDGYLEAVNACNQNSQYGNIRYHRSRRILMIQVHLKRFMFVLLLVYFSLALRPAVADIYQRKALVIGNANYNSMQALPNADKDGLGIAEKLDSLGFEVTRIINGTYEEMNEQLQRFSTSLNESTVSIIYFAGHGIQNDGVNYLIPTDADIQRSWQLKSRSLSLNTVLESLDNSLSPLKIVILDACRDNPLADRKGIPRSVRTRGGLAPVDSSSGTLISFATKPGDVASDGAADHSPYTQALLDTMGTPGISILEMFNRVGNVVKTKTSGAQIPTFESTTIPTEFCLAGCTKANVDPLAQQLQIISQAFERKDYRFLSANLSLTDGQSERLFTLFQTYDQFRMATPSIERSIENRFANATLSIVEMAGGEGRTVLPAKSWGKLELIMRKDGEEWIVNGVTNDYLDPLPGKPYPDIHAPNVVIEDRLNIGRSNNSLIISSQAEDNDKIESIRLFYRPRGSDVTFKVINLQSSSISGFYNGTIDVSGIVTSELEMYVEALDPTGNLARWPNQQQPKIINIDTETDPDASSKRWLYIGLGVLAAGAVYKFGIEDGNSTNNPNRRITITAPLP